MCEAVAPAFDEAWSKAQAAPVKHTDGTTWVQAGVMLALWTVATVGATVFKIISDGQRETLRSEILPDPSGVLVSDRATALKFWVMKLRQICWAHLVRKLVSFSERDGPTRTLARELLDCTAVVFSYWGDFKDGLLTRAELAARMAPVRADFEDTLRRAIDADIKGMSGSCADMWEHREALWTFIEVDGVEPTNNHAERELRGFVLWRRRSFGSQSDRGNRFAERLMTIAHTARKQGRERLAELRLVGRDLLMDEYLKRGFQCRNVCCCHAPLVAPPTVEFNPGRERLRPLGVRLTVGTSVYDTVRLRCAEDRARRNNSWPLTLRTIERSIS